MVGASTGSRLFCFTIAVRVCGNQKNSKWSLRAARSSKSAITSSSGIAPSTACSTNAGSHCSVTAVSTPKAPSPTRAALNSSGRSVGEQGTTAPSAVTSWSARTWVARPPRS